MTPTDAPEGWWDGFYHDLVAEMLLVRTDAAELEATLTFLTERLELEPGHRVYDQCCGIGSLTLPLAERGMEMFGADLSPMYIERAQAEAQQRGIDATLVCADAFAFVPEGKPCDAVFNWYSSFGYARSDRQNRAMLERAFETLKPGGRFALDVPNMVGLMRHFKPIMLKRRVVEGEGELLLIRESRLDIAQGLLHQVWNWVLPDGTRRQDQSALRLYLPHQIGELLTSCGFEEIQFCSTVQGHPMTEDTLRCMVMARKP
ncbi:MAG: class I SAM-dependent methyltransferase [Myxococcota bacterium]